MGSPVQFFLTYLLIPIATLVMATILAAINQKKALLSGRKLLISVAQFTLPMALAGLFGMIDLWFMPLYYLLMAVVFLVEGMLYVRQLRSLMGDEHRTEPLFVSLLTILILLMGGYAFGWVFNYFSTLKYGFWAATCVIPFAVPLVFARTYDALLAIPNEVHKVWYYPRQAREIEFEGVDYYRLMILEVELRKDPANLTEGPVKVKARATQELSFGLWFQKFIDDYNYKFPNDPIITETPDKVTYGWLFYYVRPSLFSLRRYIDFDVSVAKNRLNERHTIQAKRVEVHQQSA
ncbi:TssN family type VI secretion system protein [Fibrella sp. ES10-3-2-2]|nr:hypothetical protein A6C57_19480 [Fibrella sp. ES10-3-2-2]